MVAIDRCDQCGEAYLDDAGVPVLIPKNATTTFEMTFPISRSSITDEEILKLLKYPPNHGVDTTLPHRMDRAFVDILKTLPPNSLVLEIGCGGGQMRKWLHDNGHRYIGTDISKTRVQEWLQEFGGPDILCDAHFMPLKDNCVDAVYSSAVNEHLACPLLATKEVARILKPGGYYMGSGSFIEPWHDDSFYHMSPLGVMETLKHADFDIECIWPGWHGFRALMDMTSRFTRPVALLGEAMNMYYRSTNSTRDMLKKMKGRSVQDKILDDAKIGGAMDWIARAS